MNARAAEQCYTAADLARLLRIPARRITALVQDRELPPPALQVPGAGHKGRRWLASQVEQVVERWAIAPAQR